LGLKDETVMLCLQYYSYSITTETIENWPKMASCPAKLEKSMD
jgi:hypothetical protein